MKPQTGATQVALRTSLLMRAGLNADRKDAVAAIAEPAWYRVVLANPPTHQLLPRLRNLKKYTEEQRKPQCNHEKTGFYVTRNKRVHSTNPKHLYNVPQIIYPEDKIRRLFYQNHPWELARPRNMIEKNMNEIFQRDWSTMDQPGLRLSGESVVQRALWLSSQPEYKETHKKDDWYDSYVQARLEFYQLRMREHAEQEVAAEEAIMNGAVFGQSAIDYNLDVEQKVITKYIEDATEATKRQNA